MATTKDFARLQRRLLSSLTPLYHNIPRPSCYLSSQYLLVSSSSSSSLNSNNNNPLVYFHQRRHVMISPFVDQGQHLLTHSKNKEKSRNNNKKKKNSKQAYRLVDQQRLRVEGGTGGKGSHSFARTSRRHRMRPDGGHGGNGGCVYLMADPQTPALAYRTPHVTAESGRHGSSSEQHGRHGRNTIVRVPCGVVVRRVLDDDEEWDDERKMVVIKRIEDVEDVDADDDKEDDDNAMDAITKIDEKEDMPKLVRSSDKEKRPLKLEDKPFHNDDQGVQYFRITRANMHLFQEQEEKEEEEEDDDIWEEEEEEELVFLDRFPQNHDLPKPPRREPRRTVVLADLDQPGAHIMVARGGRGGLGSCTLVASSCHRKPDASAISRISEPRPGEIAFLELELKLIADVGLVGFPNAGKSSLLAALSRATPEIAPYPFTTLHPIIGCIEYRDGLQIRAADVPGLIGGASEGRGCGHEFLRHLERTKALLYVLDGAGVDGRSPLEDLQVLAAELRNYKDGDMLKRPAMIVANKMDLLTTEQRDAILRELGQCAKELGIVHTSEDDAVMGISAGVTGAGLATLSRSIRKVVQAHQDMCLTITTNEGEHQTQLS